MELPKNYSRTRLYRIYHHMKDRCFLKTDKNYIQYGGRGITICDEWLGESGFKNFYLWAIRNGYDEKLTIDRVDVNGDYTPSNCRWADWYGQARNRRNSNILAMNGETKTLTEWAEQYGVRQDTLWRRIYVSGMDLNTALQYSQKRDDVTKEKCIALKNLGFTISEISEQLKCSIATVERRLYGYR